MFQGVTAFLEAMDQKAEQHARQQAEVDEYEKSSDVKSVNGNMHAAVEEHVPTTRGSKVVLPVFPHQPTALHNQYANTKTNTSNSRANDGSAASSLSTSPSAKAASVAVVMGGEVSNPSQGKWNNVEEGAAAATAMMFQRDVELSLLKRKDEELDALSQEVRRHQVKAEVARQELLQRSLQVHQLEESLRTIRERFDEHKTKSRCLLEDKQREYDELLRRLELQEAGGSHEVFSGNGEKGMSDGYEAAAAKRREEELENTIASLRREKERLEAQLAAGRREAEAAQEQRLAVVQQLDFMQLDLRGAQEALESEVAAHQRSKTLLQGRQKELNELRAAVEKNGGIFTAAGTLMAFRGDDAGSRDGMMFSHQLLEKQNALEAAMRDAAEWRRRCERATARLEEERTTRVTVTHSQQAAMREAADTRPMFFRRLSSSGRLMSLVVELMNAVDAAALRFGRLLRRQPVLRLVMVFYILCLHAWIIMALLMIVWTTRMPSPANKVP